MTIDSFDERMPTRTASRFYRFELNAGEVYYCTSVKRHYVVVSANLKDSVEMEICPLADPVFYNVGQRTWGISTDGDISIDQIITQCKRNDFERIIDQRNERGKKLPPLIELSDGVDYHPISKYSVNHL